MWHEERLLIDGELVEAEGGRTYETVNPTTGGVLGVTADATVGDADRAIAAARRAFDTTSWSSDTELRSRCLRQLHRALVDNKDAMVAISVADCGIPLMLHENGPGFDAPVGMIEWYADLLDNYDFTEDLGTAEVRGAPHQRWVEREAVGVVAAIVPYNYPLQITLAKLVPALAAGCTVVVKSPPQTPWTGAALGKLIAENTDIPAGVVNMLTDNAPDVGKLLVTDPRVDMVSFTGSTPTGRHIMAAASETVKKVFLELGGKSAAVALDDCDVNTAAGGAAFGVCVHAGQGCAIPTRLLLPRAMYDEGVEVAKGVLESMPYGDPTDPGNFMGPLVSEVQRERVDGLVRTAVDEGATLVTGGKRPEHLDAGWFYEPTLLIDVDPNATIAQQEVFGPVLAVIPYDGGDDEAVRIANNSIYGLSGSVTSGDLERARSVARRIRSGTVTVNGGIYYSPDVPFGGYRQSGVGREMGVAGFEEYLETKALAEPA